MTEAVEGKSAMELELSNDLLGANTMSALAPMLVEYAQRELACTQATVLWSLDWPVNPSHYPPCLPDSEKFHRVQRALAGADARGDGVDAGGAGLTVSAVSGGARAVLLACCDREICAADPAVLARLRAYMCNALEKTRLHESVQRLEQSEQLQRALFAIADMASSELEMPDMLRGLNALIGSLMYAENMYIALYEPANDTIRFIYFADVLDDQAPSREETFPMSRFERGLTWYLIRDRRPLMGSLEELTRQVSGPLRLRGTDSLDWLGVPMIRGQTVHGALVVQSYVERPRYTAHDQAVLEFVASHVLTALERKQAHEELEHRVQLRTNELASANAVLTAEVLERQRGERLQRALFRIAELNSTLSSMEQFYPEVRSIVGELIDTRNFYIALLSDDKQELCFPYFVDELSPAPGPRKVGKGITEYVMRLGKSLLVDMADPADVAEVERLHQAGELNKQGATDSVCWLGVPLVCAGESVGVVAVQSHSLDVRYTTRDQELLTFVAYQIGSSLERRRVADELKTANAQLESRVAERTSELSEQILERQRMESVLQQRNADLEALNRELAGTQSQLLQSEKMASVGQLAAGVAHEINNPIGYVRSNLTTLARYVQDIFTVMSLYEQMEVALGSEHADLLRLQELKRRVELDYVRQDAINLLSESVEGIVRVEKIVKDLKDFSHLDNAQWQRVDLHAGLESTLNVVSHELKYKAELIKEFASLPRIQCLPFQLNQVFMNLLINAAQSIEGRGTITLRTGVDGDAVWISVTDTGKGIEAQHLNRIFEPFFTTKPVGVGTGLGLSVTYGIVQTHHGSINVESEVGRGTTFTIRLPINQAA